MLELIVSALLLVALTVVIHAIGTIYWIRYVASRYVDSEGHFLAHTALPAVMWTAVVLMSLHIVEILLWAFAYQLLLPGELEPFETAVYFSTVTFTTLGYGDITLIEHTWRLLSGIEALNGILLAGWSTALLFAVIQRSWKHLV